MKLMMKLMIGIAMPITAFAEIEVADVEKITDQAALVDTARNDENWGARKAAIQKLTDQAVLAEIARNDKDVWLRIEATKKLTDQDILADFVTNGNASVRSAAIRSLNDKDLALLRLPL